MMLVVSMPFRDSIPLTYLAGCVGSTCLEYVTGVVMERLFRVRYWDYSNQKLNFRGYICLSSTLAWGGLTILMTHVVHQYVEYVVFLIPAQVLNAVTFLLTAGIFADFSLSFKAALDMRDILLKLENAKLEWGHLQMRMDMLIALTSEEVEQRLSEYKKELTQRRNQISAHRDELARAFAEYLGELGEYAEGLESGRLKEKLMEKAASAQKEWQQRRSYLTEGMEKQLQSIFRANPTMRSKTGRKTKELKCCALPVFLFTILTAIDFLVGICQNEDMGQLLFNGGNAAGIVAFDHIFDLFGQNQLLFLNDFPVLDHIHCDIMVDKGQYIQIQHIDVAFHLQNIFFAKLSAAGILDDGYGAIQFIQLKMFIDGKTFSPFFKYFDITSCGKQQTLGKSQQSKDQGHADIDSVLGLAEIGGSFVLIHLHRDLIHSGQGVKHQHIFPGQFHLGSIQDIEILQADIILFVKETLLLDSGHIQEIQLGHYIFQADHFLEGNVFLLQHFGDIIRHPKLLWGDEYEFGAGIAHKGIDERVNGPPKFQITAQAYGKVIQMSLQRTDGQKIRKGLGGMIMPTVSGVDHWDS